MTNANSMGMNSGEMKRRNKPARKTDGLVMANPIVASKRPQNPTKKASVVNPVPPDIRPNMISGRFHPI